MSDLHPTTQVDPASVPGASNNRKLCVRHKRMADEGANVAMQQVRILLATVPAQC
jgi:hypothetical protein